MIELQLAHRSVRRYLPDEVTAAELAAVVAAAQSAATSSNLQLWSVVAVRDDERRAALSALAGRPGPHHAGAAAARLARRPRPGPRDRRRARRARPRARTSSSRPWSGSSTPRSPRRTPCSPPSRSASARSTSARCATVRRRSPQLLHLPKHVFAAFGLVVGRPDLSENARVKPRLPQSAVLHHETYDDAEHADAVAGYEGRIGEFYAQEGLSHSWVERVLARLSGPAALNGRDQLRAALQAQGFELR